MDKDKLNEIIALSSATGYLDALWDGIVDLDYKIGGYDEEIHKILDRLADEIDVINIMASKKLEDLLKGEKDE